MSFSLATTLAPSNASDAAFRLWGKAVSDQLTAMGYVKTSDTGQINWTTVTAPSLANTSQGYEIRVSNDAGGGRNVFYLKIEYGSASIAGTPSIWVTIGFGTDGAGTITAPGGANILTRRQINSGSSNASAMNSYLSGNAAEGWLILNLFAQTSSQHLHLSIERTRSVTGALQNELFALSMSGSFYSQVLPYSGLIPVVTDISSARFLNAGQSYGAGNNGLGTIAPCKGSYLMDSTNTLFANTTEYTLPGAFHYLTVYGVVKRYVVAYATAQSSSHRIMQRFDEDV